VDNLGKPVFRLHLKVIDGKYLGKRLWYDLRFAPPYIRATKTFLRSCGVKKYAQLCDGAIKGRELLAEVQEYITRIEGRETNIVVGVALAEID
jgi:hypothetical protein